MLQRFARMHALDAQLRGIHTVELCVGLDTFRPVSVERPEDHDIHSERFRVPAETLAACDAAARIMWKNIHRTTDAPILQLPSFKSASPEVNQIVCALDTCVPRADVKSTGYVVDTLHAALWSIAKTASFEDALITAVNLGGDADTIGAVTGQIAGSIYGASAIPERWKSKLAMRLYFEKATQDLLNASNEKATRPLTQIAQFAAKIFK